jgi:hypothetical protein
VRPLEPPPAVATERARRQLALDVDADRYGEIRELWKRH